MMTTQPSSSADTQDKYKNSNTSNLFDQELRFSGLHELKFQKKELIKENGEKHFTQPDREIVFQHEEKMICEVRRLGKFDAASTRTRQMLVKFKNSNIVEKLLARASMLKNYESEYECEKYKVYLQSQRRESNNYMNKS